MPCRLVQRGLRPVRRLRSGRVRIVRRVARTLRRTPGSSLRTFQLDCRKDLNGGSATALPASCWVAAGPAYFRRRPVRPSEHAAAHPKDYRGALAVERRFAGKGISRQAFAISAKIAEVDAAMRSRDINTTPEVREVHPELCFWALNDRQPMRSSKKRTAGVNERLEVLGSIEPRSREIYEGAGSKFRRKTVGRDDIVDALVAALVARERVDRLTSVPDVPPGDAKGLLMEMVF